ncbi:RES family NAD+ phosphorylase [Stakelama saccharophila]|uniref:RES family NAD+ phosphorylase n=1 Tax=Stakelama saccharophila TaxID=3075605 RepID=A0ABZ0B7L7_9SPHN|nr:RES family NAD+ phosphorylase [Stakelama sp. W311]WNO53422.1 RES family NAD+ phosphorylase [Stakelama sp. W311]
MIDPETVPVRRVEWRHARRIIRSVHPPIDLFEDVADPEDWPLLVSAEQKTNPRLMETLGTIDLVPPERRVGGPGASYLMAPFTHVSRDRPSRFTIGEYGVLYAANAFETALAETVHHHARFMARTEEPEGWTSQFREIVLDLELDAHDLRNGAGAFDEALDPDSHAASQVLAAALHAAGSDGIAYPSCRNRGGECAALFYPDLAANAIQGRHLDYHWNGTRVDFYRDVTGGEVFRIDEDPA